MASANQGITHNASSISQTPGAESTFPLFKEYKYYNSSSINFEIQIAICRLELPIDMPVEQFENEEFYMTAHLLCNQMEIHEVPINTTNAIPDSFRNALLWDVIISFPAKFRDLARNSTLVLTAWTNNREPFGGTSMTLFDEKGALKSGKQKLIFYFGRCGDKSIESETPGELYEMYSKYDENFIKEKKMEQYTIAQKQLTKESSNAEQLLDWLDKLTLKQIQSHVVVPRTPSGTKSSILSPVIDDTPSRRPNAYNSSPEFDDLNTYCCLVIDMPIFPYPVVYEDKSYPSVTPHVPALALQMLSDICIEYSTEMGPIFEFNLQGKQFSGQAFGHIIDWEMENDSNPCENMYRNLAHDAIRGRGVGTADQNLKPNLKEKERIDRIIKHPGDHIRPEDKDLLYRYRYTLTENKSALAKFLLSVDWNSEDELNELPSLLELWKTNAPIDVSDALKLLSRGQAFQYKLVRQYAVDILKNAPDQELKMVLLQLVQALRYEVSDVDTKEKKEDSVVAKPNSVADIVTKNVNFVQEVAAPTAEIQDTQLSPLAQLLIDRACHSTVLASYFYWYLKVEAQNPATGEMFENILNQFMKSLEKSSSAGQTFAEQLRALDDYLATIAKCQRDARDEKGRKDAKEAYMRKLLSDKEKHQLPRGVKAVPFPLDPSCSMMGMDPSTIFLFKSAMYPAVIDFNIKPNLEGDPLKGEISEDKKGPTRRKSAHPDSDLNADATPQPAVGTYKMIIKSGDDLRQDQLVMQLIALMDELLKKVNLDLKLLTYGILAIGPKDGIMEFVQGSAPISAVLASNGNSILTFLRLHNPDSSAYLGVKQQAMDMFVRSCAGSCVVTYLLGIGDRHLDNVMIRRNGQLFHIDFGFIFGRDPKPLPPPFRFTRAMADAMGGEESDQYKRFQSYCCQAYNWLRKSANLILNLLRLMVDAGIPDMSIHSDPVTVLGKIEERFRLDLTDEQAEHFFLGLINESLTALAPRLMELAHQFAVARR